LNVGLCEDRRAAAGRLPTSVVGQLRSAGGTTQIAKKRTLQGIIVRNTSLDDVSMQPIGSVAGHALLHDGAERRQRRPDIVAHAGRLSVDGEAAGRSMHLRSDVLHPLWHKGSNVRGAMEFERTHAKALLSDGRRLVERVLGKGYIDFLQCQEMIAHASDRVQSHWLGKLDQLPGISLGASGFVRGMLVLLRSG
jgi:hypothetical protein